MEAVYYSSPIPRDLMTLSLLGLVFDKVYFPGVHLPVTGYDQVGVALEIDRLENLPGKTRFPETVGVLRFLEHVPVLSGFLEFTGSPTEIFGDAKDIDAKFVDDLYQAIHGPHPPGWSPMHIPGWHKGLPGNNVSVDIPSSYFYMAKALKFAGEKNIPLLNDLPGLPMFSAEPKVQGDQVGLSLMLALSAVGMALKDLPVLRPLDLMEFRADHGTQLISFRAAMREYADTLQASIQAGDSFDIVEQKIQALVHGSIKDKMAELKENLSKGKTSWLDRSIDGIRMAGTLGANLIESSPSTAIAVTLLEHVPHFFKEWVDKRKETKAIERSGLYYLLQISRQAPN